MPERKQVREALAAACKAEQVFTIYRSCTPSQDLAYTTIPATEVVITYGGGMGGTSYCEYVVQETGTSKDGRGLGVDSAGHANCVNYKGEVIGLNPRYIVKRRSVDLLHITSDVTGHRNYSSTVCRKCIAHHVVAVPAGSKILVHDAGNAPSGGPVVGKGVSAILITSWDEVTPL